MTVAANLFFIHIGQQKVLGLHILSWRAGIQIPQVIGERPDVVVVVLGPTRQVLAAQLASRPGNAERGVVGALAYDGGFQRSAKFVAVQQVFHDFFLVERRRPDISRRKMKIGLFMYIVYRLLF